MSALDRKALKIALGNWFAEVTGLEPRDRENSQHWGGTWDPSKTSAPVLAHGLLFLKVVKTIGVDRRTKQYNDAAPAGEEIVPRVQGFRELLWEVRVWSRSQNEDEDASFYLEKVRDRLHSHSAIQLFSSLGLGVQNVTKTVDMTRTEHNRRVSVAQIDVTFNAAIDIADTPYGYVDRFEAESEWLDSDGTILSIEQQIKGEIQI